MSDNLYRTRLRWDGRNGLAKRDGLERPLAAKPDIGIEFYSLDYGPRVVRQIRRRACDEPVDMRDEEVEACKVFLAALA